MLGIDLTQTGDQFIRSIDMQKFRKKKRYFAEIRTLPSRQQLSADNMLTLLFQFKAFAWARKVPDVAAMFSWPGPNFTQQIDAIDGSRPTLCMITGTQPAVEVLLKLFSSVKTELRQLKGWRRQAYYYDATEETIFNKTHISEIKKNKFEKWNIGFQFETFHRRFSKTFDHKNNLVRQKTSTEKWVMGLAIRSLAQ